MFVRAWQFLCTRLCVCVCAPFALKSEREKKRGGGRRKDGQEEGKNEQREKRSIKKNGKNVPASKAFEVPGRKISKVISMK